MSTKYDYKRQLDIEEAEDVETALWFTIVNYMHHQLGWTLDDCEQRLKDELNRKIPHNIFDILQEKYGWHIEHNRLLDLGAGQGGATLEAFERGAKVSGIEPGEEFCKIGQMRLSEAGFEASKLIQAAGENIPFPDNHFDYVISLQVLEHVKNPRLIFEEIYRVLKPGGQCFISCENYLSFREQHYRIAWFPLLPKWIGSFYLRLRGLTPHFLQHYVYYTTYPQIWKLSCNAGFINRTYTALIESSRGQMERPKKVSMQIASLLHVLPFGLGSGLLRILLHIRYVCAVGVRLILQKPDSL